MYYSVFFSSYLIGIGASIRISQESWCLPYAGFFLFLFFFINMYSFWIQI